MFVSALLVSLLFLSIPHHRAVIDCGAPGHLSNGERIGSTYTFGSQVRYSCNPGYELLGVERRICQADGTWTGSVPTCRRK